jgi:hypothetical protein
MYQLESMLQVAKRFYPHAGGDKASSNNQFATRGSAVGDRAETDLILRAHQALW